MKGIQASLSANRKNERSLKIRQQASIAFGGNGLTGDCDHEEEFRFVLAELRRTFAARAIRRQQVKRTLEPAYTLVLRLLGVWALSRSPS